MLQCKVISLYSELSNTASSDVYLELDVGVFKLKVRMLTLATYLNQIFYVLWLLKTSNIITTP